MEPPVSDGADALRNEKVKVLNAMRPIDAAHLVRGQYVGYLDEPGVAAGSTVETFAAMRLEIDSWRSAGVPFYVRTGKALAATALEASRRACSSPDPTPPLPIPTSSDSGWATAMASPWGPGQGAGQPHGDSARRSAHRLRHRPGRAPGGVRAPARRRHRRRHPPVRPRGHRGGSVAGGDPGAGWQGTGPPLSRASWGPVEADRVVGGDPWHPPEVHT
jgi:glucose-6-phosphate 1-dehydrogenase